MTSASALQQLGDTQRKLLRTLLSRPQGVTIEDLCGALRISHNAVRQHLTALRARGFIEQGEAIASGGRPRAVYVLQPAGHDLFPRNYALLAQGMVEYLYAHGGVSAVQTMLSELGARLGLQAASRLAAARDAAQATRLLAEQLDALGYEAEVTQADGHDEVQAWNCVFHALARAHPDVCRFDLAFMAQATGRSVQRTACMLHGQPACRFRLGEMDSGKQR